MRREFSLKKSKEFDNIINNGKKMRSKYLFTSSINSESFKIGISIPKKLGNAVFRNKNKRRVKDIVSQLKPYDRKFFVVIIVKKEFTDLSFDNQKKILKKELDKITTNGNK